MDDANIPRGRGLTAAPAVASLGPSSMHRVFLISLLLLGLVLAAYVLISLVRRKLLDEQPEAPAGFTLPDLRQLHKEGKISDEEFERAKSRIISATQAALKRNEQQTPPPSDTQQ